MMPSILDFLAPWWLNLVGNEKSLLSVTWPSLSEHRGWGCGGGADQSNGWFSLILNIRGCGSAVVLNVC